MNVNDLDNDLLNKIQHDLEECPQFIEWNSQNVVRFGQKDRCYYMAWTNDGVPAAMYGDWRFDEKPRVWRYEHAFSQLNSFQKKQWATKLEAKQIEILAKKEIQQSEAACECRKIWMDSINADAEHEYIINKNIIPYNAKIDDKKRLIVPIYNINNEIMSLQYITESGEKKFHKNAKIKGGFGIIGIARQKRPLFICEGYATACSIHESTECMTIYALSANNLYQVVELFSTRVGVDFKEIVIVADNDTHGKGEIEGNKCREKFGCRVVVIPYVNDANDYVNSDYEKITPLSSLLIDTKKHINKIWDFINSPLDYNEWLIKDVIPKKALCMIFGHSGAGKSFISIDMAMSLTTGINKEWFGNKIDNNKTTIAYLAGEGHRGLRKRIRAWLSNNNIKPNSETVKDIDLYISSHGDNLDKPDGLNNVLSYLSDIESNIDLIFIDTLHRFMSGNENSSQDVGKVLEACNDIQTKFNCAIVLVHHSGINPTAKDRARGSSSWRAALDMEFRVEGSEDNLIKLIHTKAKDSKPIEDMEFILVESNTEELDIEMKQIKSMVIKPYKISDKLGIDVQNNPIDNSELIDTRWSDVGRKINSFIEYWHKTGRKMTPLNTGENARYLNIKEAKEILPTITEYSKKTIFNMFSPSSAFLTTLIQNELVVKDDDLNLIALPKMEELIRIKDLKRALMYINMELDATSFNEQDNTE